MEATPATSPSVFVDRPMAQPCVNGGNKNSSPAEGGDNLVLPYICMLMEEDIVDKLPYQHDDLLDEPALLKAQQPFMEIISNGAAVQMAPHNGTQQPDPAFDVFLNCKATYESSCMDAVSMAFFKGMDEANKLLPIPGDGDSADSRKKRPINESEAETGNMGRRSSKQMAPPLQRESESEEEATAREMLDRLMLDGYDPSLADMDAMVKQEKTTPRRRGGTKHAVGDDVDLHNLLMRCAEAVATNDWRGAAGLLERIKHHSSPTGDGTQRLAHCFAKALEARLAGTGSQIYHSLLAKRTSMAGVLKAYQLCMASCCFLPVMLLFSNRTICKAVAGRKKLHIVDYGLRQGIQWSDLLRCLSRREGGPPEVRFTGIDAPQPGFRPAQRIDDTGRRLSKCARQFGVPFEFRGIAKASEAVHVEDLDIDPDEVLAVNSMFHLETLMDETVVVERPNPRDVVLGTIRKMRPSVFTHTVVNGLHSSAFFMARFREALRRYAALFDMMDTVAPRDNDKRLVVEQDMFALCTMSIIACEGEERVERPQNYKQWQVQNQRAGLRQLPLDPEIVQMIKDKVRKEYHKCFVINEDQQWLLQGWKGRVLYALSTWTADYP